MRHTISTLAHMLRVLRDERDMWAHLLDRPAYMIHPRDKMVYRIYLAQTNASIARLVSIMGAASDRRAQ